MSELPDLELERVWADLAARPDIDRSIALAARRAIDDVLDAPHTGRFDIEGRDVKVLEKAFVGVRFEIRLMEELEIQRGALLDCVISGNEVDIKFTLGRNWMIPLEAWNQICLLVKADDRRSVVTALLGRMSPDLLNPGANRDRKRTLSAGLIKGLRVVALDVPLPTNVLLHMNPADREAVMEPRGQEDRFAEFFMRVPGAVVRRDLILAIGRRGDSLKRVRAIKGRLRKEGYALLCGTYVDQRELAEALGGPVPGQDEWVCLPLSSTEEATPEYRIDDPEELHGGH